MPGQKRKLTSYKPYRNSYYAGIHGMRRKGVPQHLIAEVMGLIKGRPSKVKWYQRRSKGRRAAATKINSVARGFLARKVYRRNKNWRKVFGNRRY